MKINVNDYQRRLRHEAGQDDGKPRSEQARRSRDPRRDILSVDPETIQDTKVLATYLDGRLGIDQSRI
jgi:hypothetical protein